MTYTEIFDKVVEVMRDDSSTCKDMGAGDYEKYRSMISDDMDEISFTHIVKKYIAGFGVPGHLNFANTNMRAINFRVMRYDDELYVTAAAAESDLKKKDRIVKIDGLTVPEVAERESELLMGESDERQGFLWRMVLGFAKEVEVVREGETLKESKDVRAGKDAGARENTDADADAGARENTDADADAGARENTDADADEGTRKNTDADADAGARKNTDADTDEGARKTLRIQLRSDGYTFDEEQYAMRDLGNGTLLLTLRDFNDENAIRALYAENSDKLDSCQNLIIDVRRNGGGADSAFLPLLEYCFPEGKSLEEFITGQSGIEINYSERNCRTRMEMVNEYIAAGIPDEIRPMLEGMLSELRENMGKGFVADTSEESFELVGKKLPERVFVLTDELCASSGDAFTELASYSPKVTVVGRPTMGITDYSNISEIQFDYFTLIYPTSRDRRIDEGRGLLHRGVPVAHYIPWTPEQLERDAELEYVLGLI